MSRFSVRYSYFFSIGNLLPPRRFFPEDSGIGGTDEKWAETAFAADSAGKIVREARGPTVRNADGFLF